MSNKTVVVLFGCEGHGRRTLASHMSRNFDLEPLRFDDPVEAMVKKMLVLPQDLLEAPVNVQKSVKMYCRDLHFYKETLTQKIWNLYREIDERIWVDLVIDKMNRSPSTQFIVTDGEIPQEERRYFKIAAEQRGWSFVSVLVQRDSVGPSIWYPRQFDFAVANDGTIQDLWSKGDAIGQYLLDIGTLQTIGRHDFIMTIDGHRYFPLTPHKDDVSLKAIAFSLAKTSRWNRQAKGFLSVARHSMKVADEVEALLIQQGASKEVIAFAVLWALLHDASEGYLCDVPSPLKYKTPEWYELESRNEQAIYEHFGIIEAVQPSELMRKTVLDHQIGLVSEDLYPYYELSKLIHKCDLVVAARESTLTRHPQDAFAPVAKQAVSRIDVDDSWGPAMEDAVDFENAVRRAYYAHHQKELP